MNIYIRKKIVYLLYQNTNVLNKHFIEKLEVLIKKRKNYAKKLGFELNQCNEVNDYCAVEIENNVNIYQDISGNIINIDMSNLNNSTNVDMSNNYIKITNSIEENLVCSEMTRFKMLISNVEQLVKFFEATDRKFYDINNKGNQIKTLIL